MNIRLDDLQGPEIRHLLNEHLQQMHSQTPAHSVHALDLQQLRGQDVIFWSIWLENDLAGCGALKALTPHHGEIKSMRTKAEHRGKGIGRIMVQHIIDEARRQGMQQLSLETGACSHFVAARGLYFSCGFRYCGPFADYVEDPNSVFMTLYL